MLQRNPHPYALDVPAVPATVQPGETVDWPDPIAGFEPVPDAPATTPDSDPPDAVEPDRSTKTSKRAAAPADTKETSA